MEKMKKNMMKYGMKNKEGMKKMRKKYEANAQSFSKFLDKNAQCKKAKKSHYDRQACPKNFSWFMTNESLNIKIARCIKNLATVFKSREGRSP